ncbi:type II secretion system protein [Candidatus Parcubacteria bacterium]|nr:MAG: type II secretion system protein [Candidatus Parcubacteria bacterium]
MNHNKKGFTLIELLVVIAIIGLLSTIAVISLNNARAKSRDARRLSDVKQMQTALELYFANNNLYPPDSALDCGNSWKSGGITYMGQVPCAPEPPDGTCSDANNSYNYIQQDGGESYSISYCLGAETNRIIAGLHTATPAGIADP